VRVFGSLETQRSRLHFQRPSGTVEVIFDEDQGHDPLFVRRNVGIAALTQHIGWPERNTRRQPNHRSERNRVAYLSLLWADLLPRNFSRST